MKAILITAMLFLSWPVFTLADNHTGRYLGAQPAEKPEWFKESFLEFEGDVAEATQQGKRVMLYFYQDGCPYCARLIEENFEDHQIQSMIQKHFDGITINMWGDREIVTVGGRSYTEKTFSSALKVQYTPTLLFLDEQGKVALRLNGYYPPARFRHALDFVAGKHEKQMSFSGYIQQQTSPGKGELIEEDFFSNQHDISALIGHQGRPTAVFFEAPGCEECVTLHEKVLTDKPTRQLMQQFNSLQINVFSSQQLINHEGQSEAMQDYAERQGIAYTPSVIFMDNRGKEVHRIEGFLKTFHFQSSLAYVLEKAYLQQPNFQRYIAARGEHIREQGYDTDIWGYESFHPENVKE